MRRKQCGTRFFWLADDGGLNLLDGRFTVGSSRLVGWLGRQEEPALKNAGRHLDKGAAFRMNRSSRDMGA